MTDDDIEIVARTIRGEARGELWGGMIAIACVIRNRVADPRWPNTPAAVCRQRWQFSCWNEGDASQHCTLTAAPQLFLDAAQFGLIGAPDITFNSCHYHALSVSPAWAKGKQPIIQIGNHFFYNDIA